MTPIRAEIIESNQCDAEGYTVKASAPVLAMCRKLIEAGYDPATPLHAYRGDTLCLKVRSIGEGAQWTVQDSNSGRPVLRRYKAKETTLAASPVRPPRPAPASLQPSPRMKVRVYAYPRFSRV
jgi:hypothetical protein